MKQTHAYLVSILCSFNSFCLFMHTRPVINVFVFSCKGQLCTCSWVLSLLGRYFYNMYIVERFEIVLSFNVNDNNIVHVYIIQDVPIRYRHASVFCQSDYAFLHKTVNNELSLLKVMKIPTQKGEHSCKCTWVVPIAKRENCYMTVTIKERSLPLYVNPFILYFLLTCTFWIWLIV